MWKSGGNADPTRSLSERRSSSSCGGVKGGAGGRWRSRGGSGWPLGTEKTARPSDSLSLVVVAASAERRTTLEVSPIGSDSVSNSKNLLLLHLFYFHFATFLQNSLNKVAGVESVKSLLVGLFFSSAL